MGVIMTSSLPYDKTSKESILEYARQLLGKSLAEVHPEIDLAEGLKKAGKGGFGQSVEEIHFLFKNNSISEPDFIEAGVELKSTPLKILKEGSYVSKERLVLNIIDYISEASKQFNTSSFWKKNKLLLLMFYLHVASKCAFEYIFKIIRLWSIPKEDLKIFVDDWTIIHDKISKGLAHELHGGDTLYLEACFKGSSSGAEMRSQPKTQIKAQQRAYAIKSAYLNQIILDSMTHPEMVNGMVMTKKQREKIDKKKAEFGSIFDAKQLTKSEKTFEELVVDKFKRYYGKTVSEISEDLGVALSRSPKALSYQLCRAILGVKERRIAEFEKSDLMLKTIRLEHNGRLKEAMSFSQIRYKEIINEEDWMESAWYRILTHRFFFVVFRKKKGGSDYDATLEKVFFWAIPFCDLEKAKDYWIDTRDKVRIGDYDNFMKTTDHDVCHVRPKAKNSFDMTETPQGGQARKLCYWLNRDYILNVVNGVR